MQGVPSASLELCFPWKRSFHPQSTTTFEFYHVYGNKTKDLSKSPLQWESNKRTTKSISGIFKKILNIILNFLSGFYKRRMRQVPHNFS